MALFASLNGAPLQAGLLTFPFYGAWVADVNLAGEQTFTVGERITLVLAGLTLKGYVYRGGDFAGSTKYRLCAGAGWQTTIPPAPYRQPFGLRLSMVLNDTASLVGESVEYSTEFATSTVGTFYLRQLGPASKVLAQLAPKWWIRNDGVTQIGTRTLPIVASKFEVLQGTDLGLGRIVIGTEKPQDWTPGALFSNSILTQRRVSGLSHKWSSNKLQTVVWTTP